MCPKSQIRKTLVVINFFPTSKLFGAKLKLDALEKKGFDIQLWDASELNFSESALDGYYGGGKRQFRWKNQRFFKTRNDMIEAASCLCSDDLVWYMSRFFKTFEDDWLFAILEKNNVKIYLQHFDAEVEPVSLILSLKHFMRAMKHRFLSSKINICGIVGSGTKGRRQAKIIHPKASFISIPSVKVEWELLPSLIEKPYCVFVEEALGDAPDAKLFGSAPTNDFVGYSKRINELLDKYESYYGHPVIIAGSGKTEYPKGAFGGREIIYGSTFRLIQHAAFVIGHMSLALDQCAVSRIPFLIVDDVSFSKKRRKGFKCSILSHISNPVDISLVDKNLFDNARKVDHRIFRKVTKMYLMEPGVDASYEDIVSRAFEASASK